MKNTFDPSLEDIINKGNAGRKKDLEVSYIRDEVVEKVIIDFPVGMEKIYYINKGDTNFIFFKMYRFNYFFFSVDKIECCVIPKQVNAISQDGEKMKKRVEVSEEIMNYKTTILGISDACKIIFNQFMTESNREEFENYFKHFQYLALQKFDPEKISEKYVKSFITNY